MTEIIDYYKLLGVDRGASENDIRKAYRRLVALYHPDKAGDLSPRVRKQFSEVMILLNKAKEILLHPEKRAEYDRLLEGSEVAEGVIVGEVKKGIREEILGVMKRLERALQRLQTEEGGLMEFEIMGVEGEESEGREVEMVLETMDVSEDEPEEAIVIAEALDEVEDQ